MFSKRRFSAPVLSFILLLFFIGCDTIDLYEKTVALPQQQWSGSYKPQFDFTIKDTTKPYQLYFIVRHSNKYRYNNIWINLYAKTPADTLQKFSLDLPLANKEGWLGTGMDDLFAHRVAFTIDPAKLNFNKAGQYSFTLEQIMRVDPLLDIMNVGIRLEKQKQ